MVHHTRLSFNHNQNQLEWKKRCTPKPVNPIDITTFSKCALENEPDSSCVWEKSPTWLCNIGNFSPTLINLRRNLSFVKQFKELTLWICDACRPTQSTLYNRISLEAKGKRCRMRGPQHHDRHYLFQDTIVKWGCIKNKVKKKNLMQVFIQM